MNELIEELKIVFGLRHVLYLVNGGFFVILTFITWDLFWWWSVGDWTAIDRIMFLVIWGVVNFLAVQGYKNFIKDDDD